MTDHDSKRIAQQWNREIEDEIRRPEGRRDDGPWKGVVWAAIWLLWLTALVVVVDFVKPLQW